MKCFHTLLEQYIFVSATKMLLGLNVSSSYHRENKLQHPWGQQKSFHQVGLKHICKVSQFVLKQTAPKIHSASNSLPHNSVLYTITHTEVGFSLCLKKQQEVCTTSQSSVEEPSKLDKSFIEQEVGLGTLHFAFHHRVHTAVTDMEPRSFAILSLPLGSHSIMWFWGATGLCFDIGCVMAWSHCSTVLHNTIETVQHLSISLGHTCAV